MTLSPERCLAADCERVHRYENGIYLRLLASPGVLYAKSS